MGALEECVEAVTVRMAQELRVVCGGGGDGCDEKAVEEKDGQQHGQARHLQRLALHCLELVWAAQ